MHRFGNIKSILGEYTEKYYYGFFFFSSYLYCQILNYLKRVIFVYAKRFIPSCFVTWFANVTLLYYVYQGDYEISIANQIVPSSVVENDELLENNNNSKIIHSYFSRSISFTSETDAPNINSYMSEYLDPEISNFSIIDYDSLVANWNNESSFQKKAADSFHKIDSKICIPDKTIASTLDYVLDKPCENMFK